MKKGIAILSIFILVSNMICAEQNMRNRGVHYLAPVLSVAYQNLMDNVAETNSQGGLSTSLGLNYEYRYKQLWLSAGVDAQYFFTRVSIDDNNQFSQSAYDTQGKRITLHYQMQSDNERLGSISFGVPLMIGWQSPRGFYMGAGARVSVSAMARGKATMGYTTSATYEQYIADFEDMANHYYQPYKSVGRQSVSLQPEVGILAEVGYDVLSWYHGVIERQPVLKVGAFAEYGLLNMLSNKGDKTRYTVNQENPIYLDIQPFYNTIDTRTNKFVPLTIGLKITYLFQQKSSWCNCYE